jgi:hypothetical protein
MPSWNLNIAITTPDMKYCLVTLAALLAAASSYAQGTVNFVNRITGTLDARVFYAGGGTPTPAIGGGATGDTQMVAQLWQTSGTAGPVGDPIPFRNSGAGTGYWVGEARTLAGVAENASATVKVVAWSTSLGATYDAAKAAGLGGTGESAPITITTGGGLNPPAALVGLTTFEIATIVPEPSIAALGLLGAGLLLIRRKK